MKGRPRRRHRPGLPATTVGRPLQGLEGKFLKFHGRGEGEMPAGSEEPGEGKSDAVHGEVLDVLRCQID